MSVDIEVDTSQLDKFDSDLQDRFNDIGDILQQFLASEVVPALEAEAASQRKIRTGRYSSGWFSEQQDESTAAVVNDDAPYWFFLEFGTHKMQGKPVVQTVLDDTMPELPNFITRALGLSAGNPFSGT
jgi:hypothetical protein